MKYLKTFESIEKNMIDDINDILLELKDDNKISTSIHNIEGKTYICFFNKSIHDFVRNNTKYEGGFYFDEISEYVFRLKDYLGDNLKYCSILFVEDKDTMDRVIIDLKNEDRVCDYLSDKIDNLVIELR